jgi:hypothetical protein
MRRFAVVSVLLVCACLFFAAPVFANAPDEMFGSRYTATAAGLNYQSDDFRGRSLWLVDTNVRLGEQKGGDYQVTAERRFDLQDSYPAIVDGREVTVVRNVWGTPDVVSSPSGSARFHYQGSALYEQQWWDSNSGELVRMETGQTEVDLDVMLQATDDRHEHSKGKPVFYDWGLKVGVSGALNGWGAVASGRAIENGVDYAVLPDGWFVASPFEGYFVRANEHSRFTDLSE